MLKDIAPIVYRDREGIREIRGVLQELRVDGSHGGAYREERTRGRRDRAACSVEPLLTSLELPEHDSDRAVQVLQCPVRPRHQLTVLDSLDVPHDDDVLTDESASRASREWTNPLRGLHSGMEQTSFHGLKIAACDLVHRPSRQTVSNGRHEVGAVRGHTVDVARDVHGSRSRGTCLDQAERPGTGPGRSGQRAGRHPTASAEIFGATSPPSPGMGLQSHSAHTSPVSR